MKNLILAAFAAIALFATVVPAAQADPANNYDNTSNTRAINSGLNGGGG